MLDSEQIIDYALLQLYSIRQQCVFALMEFVWKLRIHKLTGHLATLSSARQLKAVSCRPSILHFELAALYMDLTKELKRGGTRGGRNNFQWSDVSKRDREFYLGNSVAGVRTKWAVDRNEEGDANTNEELAAVRRREKAVIDAALGGTRSFAEAVRNALIDSVDSGVDDEHGKATTTNDDMEIVPKRQDKAERAKRKEERRRIREARQKRRLARQKRLEARATLPNARSPQLDSSESERESIRERWRGSSRSNRKKVPETGTKRKRSELDSSSDMEIRRTRVR